MDPKLMLVHDPRDAASDVRGVRRQLFSLLLSKTERLLGRPLLAKGEALTAEDPHMVRSVQRARKAQDAGFDIRFFFWQRYADIPLLHLCTGSHEGSSYNIAGYDFDSRATALDKAVSESVERSVWMFDENYWSRTIVARADTMTVPHIDLTRIAGFSEAQRRAEAQLHIAPDAVFSWTPCTRLATGEEVYVPTQLISGHYADNRENEPLLWVAATNGLATGNSFEEASLRGLLELIERDAFMIGYHARLTPSRITHETIRDARTQELLSLFKKFNLTVDFLLMPTDMPATVIVCAIRDTHGGPAFVIGSKAHFDPEIAIRGALAESYALYIMQRALGLYREPLPPLPWFMPHRLAFWAKSENASKIEWFLSGAHVPLPSQSANAKNVTELARAAEKNGCEVASILMSPPALQKAGIFCVATTSPSMHPLTLDTGVTYEGVPRLISMPRSLGLTPGPRPDEPHPFP